MKHVRFDVDMRFRGLASLPSAKVLIAFESTARLGSVSRAADELATSPATVRRHIATLEKLLGTRLFERCSGRLCLTVAGSSYRDAVVAGLQVIHDGVAAASRRPRE